MTMTWDFEAGTSSQRPTFGETDETKEDDVEGDSAESLREDREIDANRANDPSEPRQKRSIIENGEYAYLPVFAFSAAQNLARRYVDRNGLEHVDSLCDLREDEPYEIDGEIVSWWNDVSLSPKHPYLLINPMDFKALDVEEHSLPQIFGYEKGEQFVYSDSGGYQLMSSNSARLVSPDEHNPLEHQIHPESLMDWQIRNADAGASLDMPPYDVSGETPELDAVEYDEEWREHFHERKELSADLAGRMASRLAERRNEGMERADDYIYAPVIQGKFHPESDESLVWDWYESVREACEEQGVFPRGYTLSPKPAQNVGQLAGFLGFAVENMDDVEFLHALMVGGIKRKALLMYFAKKTDFFVTSDSSSHNIGARYHKMFLPGIGRRRQYYVDGKHGKTSREIVFESEREALNRGFDPAEISRIESRERQREMGGRWKTEIEEDGLVDQLPCRCRVCDAVERTYGMEFITEGDSSIHGALLNLHNLIRDFQIDRAVESLIRGEQEPIVRTDGDPSGRFWNDMGAYLPESSIDDLYLAMDFVRVCVDEGLSEAFRRYSIEWTQTDGRSLTRAPSRSVSGLISGWDE